MINQKPARGFTLIELLVAISIITITFGLLISAYSGVQRNSRNTQRQSDLRLIQSALEQYHADQQFYPITLPAVGTALSASGKTYLSRIPGDPQVSTKAYGYTPSPVGCQNTSASGYCQNYTLTACLENSAGCSGGDNLILTQP